jgi:hypothetical protein
MGESKGGGPVGDSDREAGAEERSGDNQRSTQWESVAEWSYTLGECIL